MKYTKEERKERRIARRAKIKAWLEKLDDTILPKANQLALNFMKAFKEITDNNVIDFLTKIIPGETDDKIVAKVREITEKAIDGLELSYDCMTEETLIKKIVCIVSSIRALPKRERAMKYNNLHAFVLSEFDDNEEEIAVYMAQASIDFINDVA